MSFDRNRLAALVAEHGAIARVVVAGARGSAPREPGAAMCLWPGGQEGTIGGGALEWEAAERARDVLAGAPDRRDRLPLGPALGQCCGGQVVLVTERWDTARLAASEGEVIARPLPGSPPAMPLPVRRLLAAARAQGELPEPGIEAGWLIEPVTRPTREIWIYGAGHVGRAIAAVLAPVPGLAVTLIDDAPARFPDPLPAGITPLVARNPADATAHAPAHAEHLILTYSHALDLEICHRLLSQGFRTAGLIGSATKWARFRKPPRRPRPRAGPDRPHPLPHRRPRARQAPPGHRRGGGGRPPPPRQRRRPSKGRPMSQAFLTVESVTKAYPGVIANDDVSFDILPGEVHALLGENGAGKSTLVKMIYGLVRPDAGHMTLNGAPYAPESPHAARTAGIAMVFQHFSLFDALDVAENVALGMETPPPMRALQSRIREVSETYGLPLDPARLVGDLSAGERQRVEIIRCLLQDPKLLIMDEPTSVLTPQEVDILFETLRKLSAEGTAILYISHKLEEIRALCDRATILRLGKVVANATPRERTARELAEMMVGGELKAPERDRHPKGEVRLTVSGLSMPSANPFGTALKDISFDVRAGEVLGIGGVAGNGQDDLLAALSGEARTAPGMVRIGPGEVGAQGPNERRRQGLLTAPEERLGHAAAPDMSLSENAALTGTIRENLSRNGFLDWPAARTFAERIIGAFDVRTPGPDHAARSLSGGNLQKFVIGREILQRPDILIVNQPTWGVDAAAAASIRQALLDLARGGAAIVVISQDLDELMEIADSFAALNEGRLTRPRPTEGLTIDEIGLMMGGAHGMEVAHIHEEAAP